MIKFLIENKCHSLPNRPKICGNILGSHHKIKYPNYSGLEKGLNTILSLQFNIFFIFSLQKKSLSLQNMIVLFNFFYP